MTHGIVFASVAGVLGLASAVAFGCSASAEDGATSSQGGDGSGAAGSGADGTGALGGALGIGGGGCQDGCSADQLSVVTCNGTVVETCAAGELCSGGACLQACEAAAASKSSVGCEYYAVMMAGYSVSVGGCFTAFVANTFPQPAHLEVNYAGTPIDLAQFAKIPSGTGQTLTYGAYDPVEGLAPGEVAILFLAQGAGGVACPVPAAMGSTQVAGTGRGEAFHVESDVPVVAYQMLPYGGGSAAVTGASLLLPTSAWDGNYIAVNAYAASPLSGAGPSLNVVAAEDATEVTLLPKVAVDGGAGVTGGPANTPLVYTLQAGEVLQITQQAELTGSPIQANKPIGLWAGHPCMTVPVNMYACDHAEQQIPPVPALGSEYVGVSHRPRSSVPENPVWRVIGAVDGTALTFDPPVSGAPATVNLGDVAEFVAADPFVVRSQDDDHPFLLVTYMTGEQTVEEFYGDADFVRVAPPAQYLRRYVFFTDPTYPETNLVAIRKRGERGFEDVDLDCAGVLEGWAPVGSSGDFEYTRIDLIRHNFEPQNGCNNGRHEMVSEGEFGLTVWGWGTPEAPGTISVSYGYPAGENVEIVNDVVVPPVPN